MDVIGAGGPLGSRQLLTAQSENTRIVRPGQAPGNRSAVRAPQATATSQSVKAQSAAIQPTSTGDPNTSQAARRASQAISAADIQNPDRPLPRGSLVNILV